jgi:hypothetical protein
MPIPTPKKIESKSDFVARCMKDKVMNEEYSDNKQRVAICYSRWEDKKAKASYVVTAASEEYIVYSEEALAAEKPLNKPFRTPKGPKKFSVYVKNDKGNVVKVNFGDPNMEIKRDNPERQKNFRARHNCDNPGPKWKARYWSCKMWSKKPVSQVTKGNCNCTPDCDCGCNGEINWGGLPDETEMKAKYPEIGSYKDVVEETEE